MSQHDFRFHLRKSLADTISGSCAEWNEAQSRVFFAVGEMFRIECVGVFEYLEMVY
jgi:hypothetical protein